MSISAEFAKTNEKIKEVEQRVVTLEASATWANDAINEIHNLHFPKIREEMATIDNKRIQLESWGRKWNLIVRGIPGKINELPKDTNVVFRKFLINELKLDRDYAGSILFEAIHRLPTPTDDENNKNIIVRFMSLVDCDTVLQQAFRELRRGCGKAVVTDLAPEVAKLRSTLLKKRKDMPEEEKKTPAWYI